MTDFDRDTRHGPDFNVLTPSALDRSGEFLNRPSSSHLCYNLIEPLTREGERMENEKYVNYTRFYRSLPLIFKADQKLFVRNSISPERETRI